MKKFDISKLFWGVLLIVGAVLLIVEAMGGLDTGIVPFKIVAGVILLGCFIQSLVNISFSGMLFSAAFECIIFSEQLGLESITPWPVLFAALLGSIGLSLIFPKRHKAYKKKEVNMSHSSTSSENGEYIRFSSRCSGVTKYISSQNLKQVDAECRYGGMEIYFNDAKILGDTAVLNLDVKCGGVEIHVPADWNVKNNMHMTFGGGSIEKAGSVDGPTLIIEGSASFGGVEVSW